MNKFINTLTQEQFEKLISDYNESGFICLKENKNDKTRLTHVNREKLKFLLTSLHASYEWYKLESKFIRRSAYNYAQQ